MRTITLLISLVIFLNTFSQTDSRLYGYVDSVTFKAAEVQPAFAGGESAWEVFLKKESPFRGTRGTVIVEFTVQKDDHVPKNVIVYRSDNASLNNEAIRLIKKSRWVPAIDRGQAVSYRMRQEIEFK